MSISNSIIPVVASNRKVHPVYYKLEKLTEKKPTAASRIIRYFPDVHLGNGHDGLATIASKHDINVRDLKIGEYAIFVNKKQTALKMFAPGNTVAYLKMPNDQRLNPAVIRRLPAFFNGTTIQYDRALREVMEIEFSDEKKRN